MNNNVKLRTSIKTTVLILFTVFLIDVPLASADDLYWGIGTGLVRQNAEGDQGLNINQFGPLIAPIDLSPDDFADITESAIGFGGYFTNGQWIVKYKLAKVKMGSDAKTTLAEGQTVKGDFFFDLTIGEITYGYTVWRSQNRKLSLTPYAGIKYLKHDLGVDLKVTEGTTTTNIKIASAENNWTDFVIGTDFNVTFSPKLSLNSSVNAAFGGSEGIFSFNTGLSWRIWKIFSIGPTFSYSAIEVKNGKPGDTDFYIYDANEFGFGLSFLFHF